MFIELHLIQNFAPSNLNRDDTGNPKDAVFGGVRRARISSQSIKRAIRHEPIFAETTKVPLGTRTRLLARKLTEKLEAAGKGEEEAKAVALAFAKAYAGKMDGERTSVLLYLSADEIQQMADGLLENWEDALKAVTADPKDKEAQKDSPIPSLVKEMVKATRDRTSAPDIALFGRMLANDPKLNIDAACQVAHAISTHRVDMDLDFFTAVDDLQESDETGSAHMNVTAFNSACFYRYARIDFDQLVKNLDGNKELARRTVEAFLRAALRAVPTGKQNAFAAQNPPSFALAVVREDGMSWSLANAFEKPVRPGRDGGLVAPSIQALDAYWGKLASVYGADGMTTAALCLEDPDELTHLKNSVKGNVPEWLDAVLQPLAKE